MEYRRLGSSGLNVSVIGLGTMTWGEQNTPDEAFAQMDYAVDQGVNLFDTAELYAIPPRAETYGRSEEIIGQWFRRSGKRDQIILASKVCGPTGWVPHIRGGKARLDVANIVAACEGSLKRLQTDYLDLYQTHWPDRSTNFFGKLGYRHTADETATPIETTLEALDLLVQQGKVRHIGISNETPWGAMRHLQIAEAEGMPRIASIQNPYSLLNRSFEVGLAEIACRERIGLLAYSPLAFGVLSGKYLGGQKPTGARLTLFAHYNRYSNPEGAQATRDYVELALKHGIDPALMALAFIRIQPFIASILVGATTMPQLRKNLSSLDTILSETVLAGIETIHRRYPNPCP